MSSSSGPFTSWILQANVALQPQWLQQNSANTRCPFPEVPRALASRYRCVPPDTARPLMSCCTCPLPTTQHSHCQWTELADLFLHVGSGVLLSGGSGRHWRWNEWPVSSARINTDSAGKSRRGERGFLSPAVGRQTSRWRLVKLHRITKEENSEGWGRASGHGRETTGMGALVPRVNAAFCKQPR